MKPKYFNAKWRLIIAVLGGLVMIFAAESDHPLEVVDDPYFILHWLGASLSVYAVFTIQHLTMRLTDRICPFKVRETSYYRRRAMIQFLVSFVPSVLTAIASAWLLVTVIGGVPLNQTSYFLYDIYIVLVALIGMQFFKGYQHYEWTRWRQEETENALRYQRIVAFLDAWQEWLATVEEDDSALTDESEEEELLTPEEVADEDSSKTLQRYAKVLEKLDWSTVAVAYSLDKHNFIMDWEGNWQLWDTSLEFLTEYMDTDNFFDAGRHLIVHRGAIEDVKVLPNSLLKLELIVEIPVKTQLSRIKSREFSYWYGIKKYGTKKG